MANPYDALKQYIDAQLNAIKPALQELFDSVSITNLTNNIDKVKSVSEAIDSITKLEPSVEYIEQVGSKINDIVNVSQYLEDIINVNINKDNINIVSDDLINETSNIKNISQNIDEVVSVAKSIQAILNVNAKLQSIEDVSTVLPEIKDLSKVWSEIAHVAEIKDNVVNVDANKYNITNVSDNMDHVVHVSDDMYKVNFIYSKYIGEFDKDPTERRDGSGLQVGDFYYNTYENELRFYTTENNWDVRLSILNIYTKGDIDQNFLNKTTSDDQSIESNNLTINHNLKVLESLSAPEIDVINETINNIQSELDNTQSGAGLGSDGRYTANTSANYIADATNLADADNKLDTQVKSNYDSIQQEISDRTNADDTLQQNIDNEVNRAKSVEGNLDDLTTEYNDNLVGSINEVVSNLSDEIDRATNTENDIKEELDNTQSGAGLAEDGTYITNSDANYISEAVSLADADNKLDAQVKVNADAIAQEITDRTNADNTLQDNIDAETNRAKSVEGDLSTLSTENKDNLVSSINEVVNNLSDEIDRATTRENDLQTEVDNIESGSGLNDDGTYTADSSSNYISDASSLKDADSKLDNQIKTNYDDIQTRLVKSNNLSDLTDIEQARANIDVYSKEEVDAKINYIDLNE